MASVQQNLATHRGSLKVFISYSRRDEELALQIIKGLQFSGYDVVYDQEDVFGAENWRKRLERLIESASVFVLLVSQSSLDSEHVDEERKIARASQKRVVPVAISNVANIEDDEVTALNFVRFDNQSFIDALAHLDATIQTRSEWVHEHTRFSDLARNWERAGNTSNRLLSGGALNEAKNWVGERQAGDPEISDVVYAFIQQSDRAEAEALSRRQRAQRRLNLLLIGIVIVSSIFSLILVGSVRQTQRLQANALVNGAQAAAEDGNWDRAIRSALLALPAEGASPISIGEEDENVALAKAILARALVQSRLLGIYDGHHGKRLWSVEFAGDDRVLTASTDTRVGVWQLNTGRRLDTLKGLHKDDVAAALFDQENNTIITGGRDGRVARWVERKRKYVLSPDVYVRRIGRKRSPVRKLELVKGRGYLLATYAFGPAQILNARTLEPFCDLRVSGSTKMSVRSLRLDAVGERAVGVLSKKYSRRAAVWRINWSATEASDRCTQTSLIGKYKPIPPVAPATELDIDARYEHRKPDEIPMDCRVVGARYPNRAHWNAIRDVWFINDTNRVVTISDDFTAKVWNVADGSLVHTLAGHCNAIRSGALSSDGKIFVTGGLDDLAILWDLETGRAKMRLRGHRDWITALAFDPSESLLATASKDATVRLWSTKDWRLRSVLKGHSNVVTALAFNSTGGQLLTASYDGTARLWSTDAVMDADVVANASHRKPRAVRWMGEGKQIIVAANRGVNIWFGDNKHSRNLIKKSNLALGSIFAVDAATLKEGGRIAVGGTRGFAVYGENPWKLLFRNSAARKKNREIRTVEFCRGNPDLLVTAGDDLTFRVWDLSKLDNSELSKPVFSGKHWGRITRAIFSSDCKRIATASTDRRIGIWSLDTRKNTRWLRGHSSWVQDIDFDDDDRLLVSGASDNTIRVWNVETGSEEAEFQGHTNTVTSVRFLHGDTYVLSGSRDGTARVWDRGTSRELSRTAAPGQSVLSLDIHNDQKQVVLGVLDGRILTWRIGWLRRASSGKLRASVCNEQLVGTRRILQIDRLPTELADPCENYGLLHAKYWRRLLRSASTGLNSQVTTTWESFTAKLR